MCMLCCQFPFPVSPIYMFCSNNDTKARISVSIFVIVKRWLETMYASWSSTCLRQLRIGLIPILFNWRYLYWNLHHKYHTACITIIRLELFKNCLKNKDCFFFFFHPLDTQRCQSWKEQDHRSLEKTNTPDQTMQHAGSTDQYELRITKLQGTLQTLQFASGSIKTTCRLTVWKYTRLFLRYIFHQYGPMRQKHKS